MTFYMVSVMVGLALPYSSSSISRTRVSGMRADETHGGRYVHTSIDVRDPASHPHRVRSLLQDFHHGAASHT